MVAPGRGTVRLEIVPWLTEAFGHPGGGRLVMEEAIAGRAGLGDYLASLAGKYPAIAEVVMDLEHGRLREHVDVVHNDTLLGARAALEAVVEAGDTLVLLPAFSGG